MANQPGETAYNLHMAYFGQAIRHWNELPQDTQQAWAEYEAELFEALGGRNG